MRHWTELGEFVGDATLYLGLLADVDTQFERQLEDCVDRNGRLWRNPKEAEEHSSPYSHGTSRDMLAGFLLGSLELSTTTELHAVCNYIRQNRKLAPTGDNRTTIMPGTWADLGDALHAKGLPVSHILGLWGYLCWFFLSPLKGLENYLSALTVWKGYQLHLILVSMLFQRRCGKRKGLFWNATLKVLDNRLPQNPIVKYLQGNLEWLEFELPHMWNRANSSSAPYVWPWAHMDHVMAAHHMPKAAVYYMEKLRDDLKQRTVQ